MYEGRAGERLTIRMVSEDFDSFLAVGLLSPTGFEEIASNDDGPDGTNSELEATLPADEVYAVRASALDAGAMGDYTVRVTRSQ